MVVSSFEPGTVPPHPGSIPRAPPGRQDRRPLSTFAVTAGHHTDGRPASAGLPSQAGLVAEGEERHRLNRLNLATLGEVPSPFLPHSFLFHPPLMCPSISAPRVSVRARCEAPRAGPG